MHRRLSQLVLPLTLFGITAALWSSHRSAPAVTAAPRAGGIAAVSADGLLTLDDLNGLSSDGALGSAVAWTVSASQGGSSMPSFCGLDSSSSQRSAGSSDQAAASFERLSLTSGEVVSEAVLTIPLGSGTLIMNYLRGIFARCASSPQASTSTFTDSSGHTFTSQLALEDYPRVGDDSFALRMLLTDDSETAAGLGDLVILQRGGAIAILGYFTIESGLGGGRVTPAMVQLDSAFSERLARRAAERLVAIGQ